MKRIIRKIQEVRVDELTSVKVNAWMLRFAILLCACVMTICGWAAVYLA
jgi:hypothetical protein